MTAIRILVTGSRGWTHTASIYAVLDELYTPDGVTVVDGKCPTGADNIASNWVRIRAAQGWNVTEEGHPAEWGRYGRRRAGFIRNDVMVARGADYCPAFWCPPSPGTEHCFTAADRMGIRTRVYLWELREVGGWTTVAQLRDGGRLREVAAR